MASLLALLSKNTPNLQTRKALIVVGLQNDFTSPKGKLPVDGQSGFLERIRHLVPAFREFGEILWIRSEYEGDRDVNSSAETGDTVIAGARGSRLRGDFRRSASNRGYHDNSATPSKRARQSESSDDEELFLTRTRKREPCCIRNSWGAEFPPEIKALIDEDRDLQLVKSYYSAFGSTSLLLTLRSRLITELFVCGCLTNLSVFATAMDAARHGIRITLIEDCLGYRKLERHQEAVRRLVNVMGADVKDSRKVIDTLRHPPSLSDEEDEEDEVTDDDDDDDDDDEEEHDHEIERSVTPPKQTIVYTANGHHILQVDNALLADDSQDEDEEVELPNVRPSASLCAKLAMQASSMSIHSPKTAPDSTRQMLPTTQCSESGKAEPSKLAGNNGRRSSDAYEPSASISRRKAGFGSSGEVSSGAAVSAIVRDKTPSPEQSTVQCWPSEIPPISISAAKLHAKPHDSSSSDQAMGRGVQLSNSKALSSVKEPSTNASSTVPITTTPAVMEADNKNAPALPTSLTRRPLFGEDKAAESAGSHMIYNLLPPELSETIFSRLESEVNWQHMYHQTGAVPRLVCCQGEIALDGSHPVYRHPTDHTLPLEPWTPTVELVRKAAETVVGHPLNHVLIQLYRSGEDFISEHSDKTLDILYGSNIVNVSFGAQRTMRLRTKRGAPLPPQGETGSLVSPPTQRTTYRIPLPHNSLLLMSLETNAEYLHGINADKRPSVEISPLEKAYGGKRVSLTFRQIATFLTADEKKIWGQGARGKTREEARSVINGEKEESEKLVRAFGAENQSSKVDWGGWYGEGSDVLHLKVEKD